MLWTVRLTNIIYNAPLGVKIINLCRSDIGNAIVLWEWDQSPCISKWLIFWASTNNEHLRDNMCRWDPQIRLECPVIGQSLNDNEAVLDRDFKIEPNNRKSETKCPILSNMEKSSVGIHSWECSNHTNDSSICLKKCQNDPDSVEGLVLL